MLKQNLLILSVALCLVSSSFAQDVETKIEKEAVKATQKSTLSVEGKLLGNVFVEGQSGEAQLPGQAAKVTLTADGVVVGSVEADSNGLFSFANIAPGTYTLHGSADPFYGTQVVEVLPYSGAAASPCSLGMCSGVSYDSYASAPAASCGGGCGTGGGRFLGGNRRLLKLGLIGGVVAIAVASPDN